MAERVYTEGFPQRWSMVHRDDCTLLVRSGDGGFLAVPSRAVCMAPKLMQGEAWLPTAKEIAHALEGSHRRELDRIFAEFCDSCGIGPPHDEKDQPVANVRAMRTWKCDRCDHVNVRPKTDTPPPQPNKILTGLHEAIEYAKADTDHPSAPAPEKHTMGVTSEELVVIDPMNPEFVDALATTRPTPSVWVTKDAESYALRKAAIVHREQEEAEARDLLDFLGDEAQSFDFDAYRDGECDILAPALEKRGFTRIGFYMIEQDSFGPLVRGCRAVDPTGKSVRFFYG